MSRRGEWVSFNSFAGGERSDFPPHLIPDDALLKAENFVLSKTGRLSKRGPVQPYLTNNVTDYLFEIALSKAFIRSDIPYYGFAIGKNQGGELGYFSFTLPNPPATKRAGALQGNPASDTAFSNTAYDLYAQNGTASNAIPMSENIGPGFNISGLPAFPVYDTSGFSPWVAFAGQTTNQYFSNVPGTFSVNSGNASVNIALGANHDKYRGAFVFLTNDYAAPTNEYVGYIIDTTSTTITVYPTPTKTFSGVASSGSLLSPYLGPRGTRLVESGNSIVPAGTTMNTIHQNRVVSVVDSTATFTTSGISGTAQKVRSSTIAWSAIAGEASTAANSGADGLLPFLLSGWPKSQQLTLDTAGIIGLVSLDANNLMVLCKDKVLMISGTLGTIVPSGSVNTSSFNVRTISNNVGCLDADSIQRTPLGIMFASQNGVYITDGSTFTNVMEGKIQQKWTVYDRSRNVLSDVNSVCGSALLGDTHYAVFTQFGPHFICDIYNDFSWSELSFSDDVDGALPSNQWEVSNTITGTTGPYGALGEIAAVSQNGQTIAYFQNYTAQQNWQISIATASDSNSSIAPPVVTSTQTLTIGLGPYSTGTKVVMTDPSKICVSNDGSVVVVGYIVDLPGSDWAKGFSVFRKNNVGVWVESQVWLPTPTNTTLYGLEIDLARGSADVIVCSRAYTTTPSQRSQILTYVYSGGSWSLASTVNNSNAQPNASKIALSYDGLYLAGCLTVQNRLDKYSRNPANSNWSFVETIIPQDITAVQYSDSRWVNVNSDITSVALTEYFGSTPVNYNVVVWKRVSGVWTRYSTGKENGTNVAFARPSLVTYSGDDYISFFQITNATFGIRIYKLSSGVFTEPWAIASQYVPYLSNTQIPLSISSDAAFVYVIDPSYSSSIGRIAINRRPPRQVKQSYGIGVRDWTGSQEVYAPRVGAVRINANSDAVVLLDSIINTDTTIETSALNFNQLLDAGTAIAFNAIGQTKAFSLGDPGVLRVYKTLEFVYKANNSNNANGPLGVYYQQGLEPVIDFSLSPTKNVEYTIGSNTKPARMSMIPRAIDNGISFGFKTFYQASDSALGNGQCALYEYSINAAQLRKGRIIQ